MHSTFHCSNSPGRSSDTVEVVSRNSFKALTVSGVKSSGEVMTPRTFYTDILYGYYMRSFIRLFYTDILCGCFIRWDDGFRRFCFSNK